MSPGARCPLPFVIFKVEVVILVLESALSFDFCQRDRDFLRFVLAVVIDFSFCLCSDPFDHPVPVRVQCLSAVNPLSISFIRGSRPHRSVQGKGQSPELRVQGWLLSGSCPPLRFFGSLLPSPRSQLPKHIPRGPVEPGDCFLGCAFHWTCCLSPASSSG